MVGADGRIFFANTEAEAILGAKDGLSARLGVLSAVGQIGVALEAAISRAALGGRGNATNPEQLFAAGCAGCFGSAVIHVAERQRKVSDDQVAIAATVGLNLKDGGAVALTVVLEVTISGVDQETAEAIVAEAHRTCPYSATVRGNIDVVLTVKAA